MRIYNPSWGLGSINLNSLGLGGAGAAKEETVLHFLHVGPCLPFKVRAFKSLVHFRFTFYPPALQTPKLNYQNTLKLHCCPSNLLLVEEAESEVKPTICCEVTSWAPAGCHQRSCKQASGSK